jgi:hypothetical protein
MLQNNRTATEQQPQGHSSLGGAPIDAAVGEEEEEEEG